MLCRPAAGPPLGSPSKASAVLCADLGVVEHVSALVGFDLNGIVDEGVDDFRPALLCAAFV